MVLEMLIFSDSYLAMIGNMLFEREIKMYRIVSIKMHSK